MIRLVLHGLKSEVSQFTFLSWARPAIVWLLTRFQIKVDNTDHVRYNHACVKSNICGEKMIIFWLQFMDTGVTLSGFYHTLCSRIGNLCLQIYQLGLNKNTTSAKCDNLFVLKCGNHILFIIWCYQNLIGARSD